jgi:hypothetical protein
LKIKFKKSWSAIFHFYKQLLRFRGWEVSIPDFGSGDRGSNPLLAPFFFLSRKLFLLCGERLFSAIFKMGSTIFVAYQKLE